jgi:hypothetical protein
VAKLTKQERAELEARLADDDADDDDDEVELTHDGKTFRGSYRRVSEAAGAWGIKLKADPPPAAAPAAAGDDDGKTVRFGRRTS